jgi:hypothetical protein
MVVAEATASLNEVNKSSETPSIVVKLRWSMQYRGALGREFSWGRCKLEVKDIYLHASLIVTWPRDPVDTSAKAVNF